VDFGRALDNIPVKFKLFGVIRASCEGQANEKAGFLRCFRFSRKSSVSVAKPQ